LYPDLVGRDLEQMIEDVGEIDVYVAGFPCQPFSSAGVQKGFDDKRGKVFFHIADMLKELQPTVFLLENVSGLVRDVDFADGCKKALASTLHIAPGAGLHTPISTHYSAQAQFLQLSAVSEIPQPVGENGRGQLLSSYP